VENNIPNNLSKEKRKVRLLIRCKDRKGLVAMISEFIFNNKGNITYLDQHVDAEHQVFFMRVEWELNGFNIPEDKISECFKTIIGDQLDLDWSLHFSDDILRMAIFVSKLPHCLYNILSGYQSGAWPVEIPLIISNHTDLQEVANQFKVPYYHLPTNQQNKLEQEQRQIELLKKYQIDFIVLARYMQILSSDFVNQYPNRIINIHHSFLPAFPGAKPYHSAYKRGVKIIGATSHYVTAELDQGPIIEQDVIRVTHRDSVADLIRKGQDLEKIVLARSIWHHIQYKILTYNHRTVIFD